MQANTYSNNNLLDTENAYKEDYLQHRECMDCKGAFITGVYLTQKVENSGREIVCPYCGSQLTEWTSYSDEESHPDDLGCLSIMYEEEG